MPTPLPAPLRWGAALLITALAVRYLPWRLGSSLNLRSPLAAALSLLLLTAELMLLGHGLLQVWLGCLGGSDGLREIEMAAESLAAQRREAERLGEPQRLPSVAVLMPSRGEPLEVIERGLRGCLAMDYPNHQVWLLDDSGRGELRELCARLGCGHLDRGERHHAKAGNLNHALGRVEADLIAVFDADVVPQTPFLSRTVGLFADPTVGFVQTPQTYMNADPLMRNLGLERWLMPDEESFYRWIEPTRQRLGAVVCAGTSFVMRRRALLDVGGFETGTTSEDLATGIRLVAAGHRGIYVPEKLSAGLAPLTIGAMVRQRCRWASGTLQVMRTRANPLAIDGLTPLQRVAYLEGILHWLLVVPFGVMIAAPLTLGLEHLAPLRVEPGSLLQYALPFQLSQLLLIRWLSDQSRGALMPELYRWLLAIPLAKTVAATLVGRPAMFQVTPKALAPTGPEELADGRLLRPLALCLAVQLVACLQLVGLLMGGWRGRVVLAEGRGTLVTLGLAWALLNSLMVLAACRGCWDRPREEAIPWLAPQLGGWLVDIQGQAVPLRVEAISETGCEVRLREGWSEAASPLALRLGHPLLAEAPWAVELACRAAEERGRGERLGLRWSSLGDGQREQLQAYLYRRPGLWPTRRAPWDPLALVMVARQLLRRRQPERWFSRSLLPIR
ncbi:MAG: glycosyltransferase [Cyanobacteriota bacterium]|nr:glycosyltransferase [Cyanobacteriota bacterium]